MSGGPGLARRPRVLLVLDSLAPGGAERSTVELLAPLRERGFDLELATLHDRAGFEGVVKQAEIPLHDLSGRGGRAAWTWRARRLIGQRRPDLVHTSLFESDVCGRTAAGLCRVPSVSTLPTERYGSAHLNAPHLNRTKIRASQALDIATARLARRLHAVSDHVADTMASHLRYPRDRIDVVYRGRPVMPHRDRAEVGAEVRRSLGLNGERIVLAVARHEQAKGLDRLLAAVPLVEERLGDDQLVVVVAGREGAQTERLHDQVSALGIHHAVRFLGHRTDIDDLQRAADVFVLPSRREGMPGSLLEAMAAGTPAVVSDLAQVAEVVGTTEALVVDADSGPDLAGAIADALLDRAGAAKRADRALAAFQERFTLARAADGMAEFYQRALGDGHG